MERRQGKRAGQLVKQNAKLEDEATFFWQCVSTAKLNGSQRVHAPASELFSKQVLFFITVTPC
jgi:hypothetical protein